jgi:hypothetical protein
VEWRDGKGRRKASRDGGTTNMTAASDFIMPKAPRNFVDVCVIYRSEDDPGMWVAHSVNTDQIGMGKCILEAYITLRKALHSLIEEYEKDPTIPLISPAPVEIQQRLKLARPLPKVLLDRAEELIARRKQPSRMIQPYGGQFSNLRADLPIELAIK